MPLRRSLKTLILAWTLMGGVATFGPMIPASAAPVPGNGTAVSYSLGIQSGLVSSNPVSANIGGDGTVLFFTPSRTFGLDHPNNALECIDKLTGGNCGSQFPLSVESAIPGNAGSGASLILPQVMNSDFSKFYAFAGNANGLWAICFDISQLAWCGSKKLLASGNNIYPVIALGDGRLFGVYGGGASATSAGNLTVLCAQVPAMSDCSTNLDANSILPVPGDAPAGSTNAYFGLGASHLQGSQFTVSSYLGYEVGSVFTNKSNAVCVDLVTKKTCGPVKTSQRSGGASTPPPSGPQKSTVYDSQGRVSARCGKGSGAWICASALDGSEVSAPAGWTDTFFYKGDIVPLVVGQRVFAIENVSPTEANIRCINFVTNQACSNFPIQVHDTSFLYANSLISDPTSPSCLWIRADEGTGPGGTGQVQNFDAFTGRPCGGTGAPSARILMNQFVENSSVCAPSKLGTLHVDSSAPYTDSSVTFLDGDGNVINSVPVQHFDNGGNIDLSGLGLPLSTPLPQMEVTLNTGSNSTFTLTMNWDGSYDPSCTVDGQTATSLVSVTNPTITTVNANQGLVAGGESITINGTGFQNGATVTIGGKDCTNVVVVSATMITCATPAGAEGATTLRVTNPDVGTAEATFTYVDNTPSPTVTAISPNSDDEIGGTTVTISGTNFQAGATVTIGGQTCANVVVVSSTQITCTDPNLSTGRYTVEVVNPDNRAGSLVDGMAYHAPGAGPAPKFTSVSPNWDRTDGGTTITITGTHFVDGATVTIGGVACTNVVVVSSTQATCTDPAMQPGSYTLRVTNPDGQWDQGVNAFTYALPTITKIVAKSGPKEGGNKVTITGTGFQEGDYILIGGLTCTNNVIVSSTKITCSIPAMADGQTPGPVDVTLNDPALDFNLLPTLRSGYTYLDTSKAGGPVETLDVAVTGNGTVGAAIAQGTLSSGGNAFYPRGTKETLVARPARGMRAVWGGACAGNQTNRCTVSMTRARTVKVVFAHDVRLPVFFFETDKWKVTTTAAQRAAIVHDLTTLAADGVTHFYLHGYADITSTMGHNAFLGAQRAHAVANYLNALAHRNGITGLTFGRVPVGQTTEFGGWYFLNRRTAVSY